MKAIAFSIVLMLATAQFSFAQDESAPTQESQVSLDSPKKMAYVLCKSGPIVRTLRIVKKNENCRTLYTKDGVEAVMSRSNTEDICIGVFEKILVNLEKGNWRCKDVSTSRISFAE